MILAAVGIYGIISYSVAQRTQEIGIRMSLGAGRHDVLGLVLRQGIVITATGILFGISGAAAVTRYLHGMLFRITPLDSVTFATVVLIFTLIALAAFYVPARRATKVDPLEALRHE
jgi:putative ABC transport system permease protein